MAIPYPLLNQFLILCIIWYGLVTTANSKMDFLLNPPVNVFDFFIFQTRNQYIFICHDMSLGVFFSTQISFSPTVHTGVTPDSCLHFDYVTVNSNVLALTPQRSYIGKLCYSINNPLCIKTSPGCVRDQLIVNHA